MPDTSKWGVILSSQSIQSFQDSGVGDTEKQGQTKLGQSLAKCDTYAKPVDWALARCRPRSISLSPHAVTLTLTPSALAKGEWFPVDMPTTSYDPLGTIVLLAIGEKTLLPLAHQSYLKGENKVRVRASQQDFLALAKLAGRSPDREQAFVLFTVDLPSPEPQTALAQFDPKLWVWDRDQWRAKTNGDTMAGKRVAFCVHGLGGNQNDWLCFVPSLIQAFSSKKEGSAAFYDTIWAFSYKSNAHLDLVGAELAKMAAPHFQQATGVDLFAHSMGNLVSRYAMETEALGDNRLRSEWIPHYISLAGVHEGVPVRSLQGQLWFELLFPFATRNLLTFFIPMINDFESSDPNAFLGNLNQELAPDHASAKYYTCGGTKPGLLGPIMNFIYQNSLFKGNKVDNDGLVAQYSAQALSGVLDTKSDFYKENRAKETSVTAMFDLEHNELVGMGIDGCLPTKEASGDITPFGLLLEQLATWIHP